MSKHPHVERVVSVVQSGSAGARSALAASWWRSLERHGLNPGEKRAPERVTEAALRAHRERLGSFLTVAAPKLDVLFGLVGQSGCGVVLTDEDGIILDHRFNEGDTDVFDSWGLALGADWSEASEGTNGIGTCLTERRRVTIHRDEHFYARNTGMSCMDAPIFGPDGRIVAALDVSSARADQTEAFNRLIAATVAQTARTIEADFFRASFADARIIVAGGEDRDGSALLAVDQDDIVIGATRSARQAYGMASAGPITAMPASDLFGKADGASGFERAERAAVMRALTRAGGNVSEAARALGIGRATLYRRMKRLGIGE